MRTSIVVAAAAILTIFPVAAVSSSAAATSSRDGSTASSVGHQESRSKKNCTPGYKPCLPPASDYDCYGGTGNGPAYTGRVKVKGYDIYGLDYDRDGIGCETVSFWGPA